MLFQAIFYSSCFGNIVERLEGEESWSKVRQGGYLEHSSYDERQRELLRLSTEILCWRVYVSRKTKIEPSITCLRDLEARHGPRTDVRTFQRRKEVERCFARRAVQAKKTFSFPSSPCLDEKQKGIRAIYLFAFCKHL